MEKFWHCKIKGEFSGRVINNQLSKSKQTLKKNFAYYTKMFAKISIICIIIFDKFHNIMTWLRHTLKNLLNFLEKIKQLLIKKSDETTNNRQDLSIKSEKPTPQNSVITGQQIAELLTKLDYKFHHIPPESHEVQKFHHFHMTITDDNHQSWHCVLRYAEFLEFLSVYSTFPFTVPEKHYPQMLAMITHLNYDMMAGNLELDLTDGELRVKTSLDLEATGVNDFLLLYLLRSNFATVSNYFETLENIIKQETPIENVHEAIAQILYKEQERTFFMPSETMQ